MNTTKHLWSCFEVKKNLFESIRKKIAASQGSRAFGKEFCQHPTIAPFKSINFYAYDTYRNQLMKLFGKEENTNFERFLGGITATFVYTLGHHGCWWEALGGIIGAFCHMIQTEGFFSLYKGIVPSIISMAPSGAVYYGVYDIMKSAFLLRAIVGCCFEVATYSFEVVRRHFQMQVLPSAAISYFVYKFMKIVLKVESTCIVNPIKKNSGFAPAS
ncbi:hypothetical protein AAG906_019929 [Vitis piasezkii]